MNFEIVIAACLAAFSAGLIDAIVGGGGLIQLPALLLLLPEAPVVALLGTNKLSSIAGTFSALMTYARRIVLPWRLLIPAAGVAFMGSLGGAWMATLFPPTFLKPVILALLCAVLAYTVFRPGLGAAVESLHRHAASRMHAASGVIGAYDGFLGPGTGNFLIFSFVRWIGMSFLLASASAKVINCSTNLAAIALFGSTGNIIYSLALPMMAANLLGGYLGAKLAIARGNRFIRIVFIGVAGTLMLRIGFDVFAG